MDNDIYTTILGVFVFMLYILAMGLWKYMRSHNCLPSQEEIEEMKNNMNDMMEKGLQHEETIRDLRNELELTKQSNMNYEKKSIMGRYKCTI